VTALLVGAAVLTAAGAGVMVWASDLPLRPPYLRSRRKQQHRQSLTPSWDSRFSTGETSEKLTDLLFLADMSARDLRRRRAGFAVFGSVFLGGVALLFAGPIAAVPAVAAGGGAGWVIPLMSVKSKASEFRFQLQQALPQFLSLTAMAMTSLSLSDAIQYAASASDHRTFRVLRELIPPPNSTKSFGDALFDFGKRYHLPEMSNRGTILRTTAREGGRNVTETIQRQAADCRKSTNASLEEEITSRVVLGTSTPLAIIMALFVFILYPVAGIDTNPVRDFQPGETTTAAGP